MHTYHPKVTLLNNAHVDGLVDHPKSLNLAYRDKDKEY